MSTLHVTLYQSIRETKAQRAHLHAVASKLETYHNIAHIKKMMETLINNIQDYEVVDKPQHVVLKSKATGLPVIQVSVKKD